MANNYYEILELNNTGCSIDDIKANYRKLCKLHHPDRGGSHEKFIKITEACNTLSNPDKRKEYDSIHGFNDAYKNSIFYQFYGHLKDIHDTLTISIQDALYGRSIKLNIFQKKLNPNHLWSSQQQELDQFIPPGYVTGDQFIIRGKGNKFPNFSGDVVLTIKVASDKSFTVDGHNLIYKVDISLKRSLCGAKVTIPHITGESITINIKHVIPQGYNHIIPGKGIPFQKDHNNKNADQYGDLIINFNVVYPSDPLVLDDDIKQALDNILPN